LPHLGYRSYDCSLVPFSNVEHLPHAELEWKNFKAYVLRFVGCRLDNVH